MLQILGLLAGVAIELHYGLPMSTYLLIMAISAVSIGACLLSAFAWSETWEEDGILYGTDTVAVTTGGWDRPGVESFLGSLTVAKSAH